MKLALFGYGKMGRMVEQAAVREGLSVVCVIDPLVGSRGQLDEADVAVDFTTPDTVIDNTRMAASAGIAMVVGTTGWYGKLAEARSIVELTETGFVYSSK